MGPTNNTEHGVFCIDARNNVLIPELSHTVQSKPNGGRSLNCTPNVVYPRDNVMCLTPWDHESYRVYDTDGAYHTLFAANNAGLMHDSVVYAVDLYNGEMGEVFATVGANSCVSANHAGPAVLCFQLCGDRDNPSLSWSGRSAYCLPANPMSDRGQAVMYENHSQDSRYTGPLKVSQTVSQQFGTGGNNTPIIVEVKR